jgi:D-alanyl-D-alanine carboxypeptidase
MGDSLEALKRQLPRRADMPFVELDGEAVILNPTTNELFVLTPTASVIWQCLDGIGTVGDLVGDLIGVFQGDEGAIRTDVVNLIADFEAQGLTG